MFAASQSPLKQRAFLRQIALMFMAIITLMITPYANALFVSAPKDPLPLIKKTFPQATNISDKEDFSQEEGAALPVRTIKKVDAILGYAFETNDISPIPAYSGEPVNVLVIINPKGEFLSQQVIEHHEPIILAGIPESKLVKFAEQYTGFNVDNRIKVGGSKDENTISIDGLSGATVTVAVMNNAIMRSATKVAESLGLIARTETTTQPKSTIKKDVFSEKTWVDLTGDGSIRKLYLTRESVDKAFIGTDAEHVDEASKEQKADQFAEIYYTLLDIPTVGKNILYPADYDWLINKLKPNEHLLGVFGTGYSYKGSGYVRGGIFDRIQIHQGDTSFSFRDLDHNRLNDLTNSGAPRFKEMSAFIIRADKDFDPGANWQLELLVRRQTGPVDSVFSSFKADYQALAPYVDTPAVIVPVEPPTLTEQMWQNKQGAVIGVSIMIIILFLILFFQDALVKHPTFVHYLRHTFLVATVILIGWTWAGQLSVVNVFTFLHALMSGFSWDLFLLDPVIFILWCAAAASMLLWGRAVYCGWLCPFGALQELTNQVARWVKIPQIELPYAVHERLWAIKYLILLFLFGISLDSIAMAEQFAEIEPFKTTFLLHFDRQWPFVAWAVFLIVINLFNRKTFCRYLCPLGAALSISNSVRLFNWLKRRPECGSPCNICAKECEIQAIQPDGVINMRECHYCLDCQITYYNDKKCPPLKKLAYKKSKAQDIIPTVEVTQTTP